jgi:hypothetical protein
MTFSTPHIGHSRHGIFFTKLDCQFNAEKDHDLPVTFGVAGNPTTTPFTSSTTYPVREMKNVLKQSLSENAYL